MAPLLHEKALDARLVACYDETVSEKPEKDLERSLTVSNFYRGVVAALFGLIPRSPVGVSATAFNLDARETIMSGEICKLCGEFVPKGEKLLHREIEALMLAHIREKHPEWQEADGICPKCYDALKRLIAEVDNLV